MQSKFGHIQFNIQAAHMPFYKDLLAFLGWKTIVAAEDVLGVVDAHGGSLWFSGHVKDVGNDYDGPGMNHFAISVTQQTDVDAAATYLREQGLALLFDTPQHRAEFSQGPEHTYYQVMFESPDRILLEVVYIGPKSA
ncbi:hypothetical protein BH10CHL1_BH10CHL1_49060 [soil metagenome]